MVSYMPLRKLFYMVTIFLVCVIVSRLSLAMSGQRKSAAEHRRFCGELIDWDLHPVKNSPSMTPADPLGGVLSISVRDPRGQLRQFHLTSETQVLQGNERLAPSEWVEAVGGWRRGMPERYPDIYLYLQPDGSVKTVNIFSERDGGILLRATKDALWIRTDPQHNWGIWENYEQMDYACPGWEIDPAMLSLSQVRRIRISQRTRFSFNLDPVDSATIRRSKGVYVFIFFDRLGNAKYVDAVRVHEWWYTGESGFEVIQPSEKNALRYLLDLASKKRYALAPNVRVYSGRERVPIESFRGPLVRKFLNATRDSKKGWITHIFLTEALE